MSKRNIDQVNEQIVENNIEATEADGVPKPKFAKRDNEYKLNIGAYMGELLEGIAQVLKDGVPKYGHENWLKGEDYMSIVSILNSAERHFHEVKQGNDYDAESGRKHIFHIVTNLLFVLTLKDLYPHLDDRIKVKPRIEKIGLDVDGVCADFSKAWFELTGKVMKNWHCSYDMRDIFDKLRQESADLDILRQKGYKDVSESDNLTKLDQFFLCMDKISDETFGFTPDCYVTSRPVASKITQMWIENVGLPTVEVITVNKCSDKVDVLKSRQVNVYVDDKPENVMAINNSNNLDIYKNSKKFKTIKCFCFQRDYNKDYDFRGDIFIKKLSDVAPTYTFNAF